MKMIFKTEEEYLRYTDDIVDAFYDEDLPKLSKLLGHKVRSQKDAEKYFNDVFKKKVIIRKKQ